MTLPKPEAGYAPISWNEFRETGLFQFVNQILHAFGLVIVVECDKESGEIGRVYPARCSCRGFAHEHQTEAYTKIARYLEAHASDLVEDVERE